MAQFFPSLDNISRLRVAPTDGENALLNFLNTSLDDSYEVYYQPFLNGDNPDIIVMKKDAGVLIFEVKDYDLDKYELNERKNWVLKNVKNLQGKRQPIRSPIQQVLEYKKNIYNLHIDGLLEKRISDYRYLAIVTCCVYFHNASENSVNTFLTADFRDDEKYLKFLQYFELLGRDSLNKQRIDRLIQVRRLNNRSYLFNEELYNSFKRYLKPPEHLIEQGRDIVYTDEQERIIQSKNKTQQKVKGVAGSGKTLALAKRAVNAHLRTGGPVLILTFNISLRNYIHDRISEVKEKFAWSNFIILHYHQFIKSHHNNISYIPDPDNPINTGGQKFKAIIIDEIQDYEKEWVTHIKTFLDEDGEFVVFGDEKQNIYQRELDEKKPYTGIPGQWNILKKSFRVTNEIANLATFFQKAFFTDKYEYDEIQVQRNLFDSSNLNYHYLESPDIGKITSIYSEFVKTHNVHDGDICFQSAKVELLRLIDKAIRSTNKITKSMFETQEVYEKFKKDFTDKNGVLDDEKLNEEIETVRRNKKFNFWMNTPPGAVKLSTVHSFKGWEINTLFLVIEHGEADKFTSDELIYTAITRCRQNLVILNIGNRRYHDFFNKHVPN